MEHEQIINLEIDGLPKILKTREKEVRIPPHKRQATLCKGYKERFEPGHKCGPKNQIVRVYSVPQLNAAISFYEELAKKPGMLALLGDVKFVAPSKIEAICQDYFKAFQIKNPDPKDTSKYNAFLKNYPELKDFNLMASESDLVNRVLAAESKPKSHDEVMQRMEEILPEQYYLQINCCKEHQEATVMHAINLTWHRYTAKHKKLPVYREDMDVFEDSLIYAPDSNNGMVVRLCCDIAPCILGKAYKIEHFFYNLMLKKS